MERAAEKGKAIAAAVEGVEKHWGSSASGSNTFIETLRERLFKLSSSTIILGNPMLVIVSPSDTVLMATKAMLESHTSSAIITVDNKPRGILTSKDILMRVIVVGLSPESTEVEKVMTPNPECPQVDTPIIEALHIMNKGKFLHLPFLSLILYNSYVKVAHLFGQMELFLLLLMCFKSLMQLWPHESSFRLTSEGGADIGRAFFPSPTLPNTFAFKIQDRKGRMHRFMCGGEAK